jgi:hypothetical protein
MTYWEKIIPPHIKVLKLYAIVIIVLSFTELFFGLVLFGKLSVIPGDFLVYIKGMTLFADIALAFITLRFIRENYPDKLPSIKKQYRFLLVLYLTLFSLLVYVNYIYQMIKVFFSLGDYIMGVELSNEIFIAVTIIALVIFKSVFLPLLQVGSFKLVKEVRGNSRNQQLRQTTCFKKMAMILYRIFSYFLIAIAAILGIAALFVLLVALSNPALLLSVFIIVAVVIYSFSSFFFLLNGIDGKLQLKPKMKDLINVNAFVALVFVMRILFQSVSFISNPDILNDIMKQFAEFQNAKFPLPAELMVKMMKGVIWFLLFYALILGTHISMTFRLMKQYAHLFGEKKIDDTPSAGIE